MPWGVPHKHGIAALEKGDLLVKQPVIRCQSGQKDQGKPLIRSLPGYPVMNGAGFCLIYGFFHSARLSSNPPSSFGEGRFVNKTTVSAVLSLRIPLVSLPLPIHAGE